MGLEKICISARHKQRHEGDTQFTGLGLGYLAERLGNLKSFSLCSAKNDPGPLQDILEMDITGQ